MSPHAHHVGYPPSRNLLLSGAEIYSKGACPWGDLTWGDTVFEFEGHHYQIIGSKDAEISWRQATMDANSRCYGGQPGYLANIDTEGACVIVGGGVVT